MSLIVSSLSQKKKKKPMALDATVDKRKSAGEPMLSQFLPYVSSIDDNTILLKDGDLMTSILIGGLDATTSKSQVVEDLSLMFSDMVSQDTEGLGFYVHRISSLTFPHLSPIEGDSFNAEIDRRWQQKLGNSGLRDRFIMLTLVLRPSKLNSFFSFFSANREERQREEKAIEAAKLRRIAGSYVDAFKDIGARQLSISSGEWLGLLKTLMNGVYEPVKEGARFMPIGDLIADSNLNFTGEVITHFGVSAQTMRYGAVMTLKNYPSGSFAGAMDGLDLRYDMVISQSFTRINDTTASEKIERIRRQRISAEDKAISLAEQLTVAGDDLASGRLVFGDHHMSVMIFTDTERDLDDACALVKRAVTRGGGVVVREKLALQAEFFAAHPGNYNFRTRAAMISSKNWADFAALHCRPSGLRDGRIPWGESVTVLPTAFGEPFRFNFHDAGSVDERTKGHSLILGQTGSGKTLGTAFLLSQASRLGCRVFLFDKDRGFETAVRAMGGDYSPVEMGVPTGFNPIRAENTPKGRSWLKQWFHALLEFDGKKLTSDQREIVAEKIDASVSASEGLQNFRSFTELLKSVDDNGDLKSRFSRWVGDGEFNWLFSGDGADSLTLNGDFVAFDLSEIFDNNVVRTAWLSYIFRRLETVVKDERPTLIVLDEAWKLLNDEYFEAQLEDWMVTMRKNNCAVVLLTQRVSHLTKSKASSSILGSVATRIIYPSSENTDEELNPLNLTDAEARFLKSPNNNQRLAWLKSGSDSVIVDMDLSALGNGLKVLGGGRGVNAPDGWRDNKEFWKEVMSDA